MGQTFDALAAEDIHFPNAIIKKGETIIVDRQGERTQVLTPSGFHLLDSKYVGEIVKVYPSVLASLPT